MRQWIEKLAKVSKERGVFCNGQIYIDAIYKWHSYGCDNIYYVYIDAGTETSNIKIYQDEYDLLSEVKDLVANNTKDNIIKELENL